MFNTIEEWVQEIVAIGESESEDAAIKVNHADTMVETFEPYVKETILAAMVFDIFQTLATLSPKDALWVTDHIVEVAHNLLTQKAQEMFTSALGKIPGVKVFTSPEQAKEYFEKMEAEKNE